MTRKALVRLIHSTALKDAETKVFDKGFNLLAGAWAPPGAYTATSWILPTYGNIPKFKNTSTPTNISVIGNELHMRGVKYRFFIRMASTSNAFGQLHVRMSLLSTSRPDFITNPTDPVSGIPAAWYEPDTVLPITFQRWDTQEVKVLKSRRFVINPATTGVANLKMFNFWAPLRGKKTLDTDENLVANSYVNYFRGKNYFLAVEIYGPQGNDLTTALSMSYDQVSYFKDP